MVKVAVIGAGAVGLSTAYNIQNRVPHADVTVIADKFDQDTTSDGAAGLFRPSSYEVDAAKVPEERVVRWFESGFKHYSKLALSSECSSSGCYVLHGYFFTNQPYNPLKRELVFSTTELSQDEVKKFNVPYKYGWLLATCLIECRKYLPWLRTKIESQGGTIRKGRINSLGELVEEFDIVVNCTGLGSRYLVNDNKMFAVRGQVLRMDAPWLKHFVFTDDYTYIFPSSDTVVFGGTRGRDNYNKEVDPADTEDILRRLGNLWPSIEGAKIKRVWVGLRPQREPLRLEKEILHCPKGKLKVVHNYGHGPSGIMLSWGTSLEAADLVNEFTRESYKSML